jgi:nucleotide-binding universal stress UspA family protein
MKGTTSMILPDSQTRIALRNILFATDFSSVSEAALSYALSVARRYDSQLYVGHVIRPDAYQLVPPEAMDAALEQTRRYAEQRMAELLISGRLRGIPHQVLLGQGDLWPVLSDMLRTHEIDLIVAGTHGRTGVRKLLLGSVAEEIFRLSPVPVLTVGPRVPSEAQTETELCQILYATDFARTSEHAASYALSLAQEHQAHLTLLHVVQEPTEISDHSKARLQGFFARRLREMVPEEAESWCDPRFAVEFGAPSDCILNAARDSQADLIVLGVRRSATFAGHLPPATAYKVVCQSQCPVLTVRG